MDVFWLWHIHELPGGAGDGKLIGVIGRGLDAERAKHRVLPQPGFRDVPDAFQISPYAAGRDHWTKGYVSDSPESLVQQVGSRTETDAAPDRGGMPAFPGSWLLASPR
jgi:hypothetical protein